MIDTADWVAPFAHALDRHDQPDGVVALLAAIRSVDAGFDTYDLYAPTAIIQGAGGQVTDWAGQPLSLQWHGRVIASGDADLHAQALERLAG